MKKIALVSAVVVLSAACSDSGSDADGKGTVTFTTWGEDFIEKEIPSKDPATGEVIVEDGWTIRFSKFLVVISDVSVGEPDREPVAKMTTPKLYDMHAPGRKPVVAFTDLPGKAYTHVSYGVAPATPAIDLGGGATDADKQLMVQGGYSVYVEGAFTKDTTTKSFTWGFRTNTLYDRCEGEVSGKKTEGVVVTNGGNDAVELTIHGDHLFYDDLQSPDAKLRVDALANADADADGKVTLEELAAVQLADSQKIPTGTYGTGSASNVNDLRAFVEALSRTLGHFRGEGECLARTR